MPVKKVAIRAINRSFWQDGERLIVQAVVGLSIEPSLSDTRTDFDPEVGADTDEADIEQAMKVCAQEEPISDLMGSEFRIRHDVRGFERHERSLAGHRALPLVRVGDQDSK